LEVDESPLVVVGVERTADAPFLPIRAEHEVVDDQLALAPEEVRKRLFAVRPIEGVGPFDLDPGQRAALPAQLVTKPGQLLLLLQELLACRDPFLARDDGMIWHDPLRMIGARGYRDAPD